MRLEHLAKAPLRDQAPTDIADVEDDRGNFRNVQQIRGNDFTDPPSSVDVQESALNRVTVAWHSD